MKVLLDTNILLRLSEKTHPHHLPAVEALRHWAGEGHTFCIGSQTISEFLAVAPRPLKDRGLGMAPAVADGELSKVTSALDVLYDSPAIMTELRRLIVAHDVAGKSVHDTRLVAAMNVNGIKEIATFNGHDFSRFNMISVFDPSKLPSPPFPAEQ